MAGLGGFHTSRPFLQRSNAKLANRIRNEASVFDRAVQRESEKQRESKKHTERIKKEIQLVKKAAEKNKQSEAEQEHAAEEEEEDDPMQKTQKPKKEDPMLQAVQNQAKGKPEVDSFRRGSHFGAKHLRTQEFGTHPLSERCWDSSSEAVFVSLKPLAAPPLDGPTRLNGHVPKTSKGFWRTDPGAIRKVPPPPPKRTTPRLEPADHEADPFDQPPARSWLHESPAVGNPEAGFHVHTFASYSRRKTHWPCTDEGRGIGSPMHAI